MRLNELSPSKGAHRSARRVGRGTGCGSGKTSGRGHKGQKSRSGGNIRAGYEGGQMPIQRRLPKRGFKNPFRKDYAVINIRDLKAFDKDSVVDEKALVDAGLVHGPRSGVKLLGQGSIDYALVVKVNKCSDAARKGVETAGGKVELI